MGDRPAYIRTRKLFLIIAGLLIPLMLFALQVDQKNFVARLLQNAFYSPFWSVSNKMTSLVYVYNHNRGAEGGECEAEIRPDGLGTEPSRRSALSAKCCDCFRDPIFD